MYTVTALLILDAEGQRVLAKYYAPPHQGTPGTGIVADLGAGAGAPGAGGLVTLKEQKAFEKSVFEKTRRGGGEFRTLNWLRWALWARDVDQFSYGMVLHPTRVL